MGSVGKAGAGGEAGQQPQQQQGLDGKATVEEVRAYYKDHFGISIGDSFMNKLSRYSMIESAQQLDKFYSMLPDDVKQLLDGVQFVPYTKANAYAG